METQQTLIPQNSPILTYSLEDSPVRAFRLLESVEDLTIPEALSFLTSRGLLKQNNQNIFYLKMLKDCFLTTTEELLKPSCPPLRNWVMTRKRWFLTATFTSPRPGHES